jgi:hypothetical protein
VQRRAERGVSPREVGWERAVRVSLWSVLLLASVAACADSLPTTVGDRESNPGFDVRPSPLIGSWEARLLADVGIEVSANRLQWRFDPDGTCEFFRRQVAGNGIRRFEDRRCTYVDLGTTVAVTFEDDGVTRYFEYTVFFDLIPRLILDSIEYDQIDR